MTGLLGVPASCCCLSARVGDGACLEIIRHGIGRQMTFYRQKQPLVWDAGEIVAAVKERIDLSRAKGLIDGVEHMQEIEDFRL